MKLTIITGLSGAGKSHALRCFEDLGYYCIDNMPPKLLPEFLKLATTSSPAIEKAAFVMDIRSGDFFAALNDSLAAVKAQKINYNIMFLEASDSTLIKRYKETRRNHPLAGEGNIASGIKLERERLEHIKKAADFIIDTSILKVAGLQKEIKRLILSDGNEDEFTINLVSFGFKNGVYPEADWVCDVRFIPNPFYLMSLKDLTGNNKKVREYVMKFEYTKLFLENISKLVLSLIPGYINEGKYSIVLAIGCTGGQHRSVAMVNELADIFKESGKHVMVLNRDL